jgi:hypothetical protein
VSDRDSATCFSKLVTKFRYASQFNVTVAQGNLLSQRALAARDKGEARARSCGVADLPEPVRRQAGSMPISALSTSIYVPKAPAEFWSIASSVKPAASTSARTPKRMAAFASYGYHVFCVTVIASLSRVPPVQIH